MSGDKELAARVEQTWGKLRTDRNPQREQVVGDMRKLLAGSHGDAAQGQVVFMKLCGQCHKLHGTGQDVGPDITVNGRASFDQLLNNVFDPSLVIGNAYQARTVVTDDGRVLTGLLVEDNPQRIVLKLQGGKLETIARGDVEEMEISKLSLMPEGVEKQLSPQELIDLFALLKLDKSPTDPAAKPLPNFSELK
jgi:putative heme-binding domain-containing protein